MTIEDIKAIIKKEGQVKNFTYKGYKCRIVRHTGWKQDKVSKDFHFFGMFHLCGYVQLPEGHKYFKKDYDSIDVGVHGGLTYSNSFFPDKPKEPKGWVIGFDCAHAMDLSYIMGLPHDWDTYRTMDYVRDELKQLVDQLEKVA